MAETGVFPRPPDRSADPIDGVAALPKIDLHIHSETAARIERLVARREGREPYDWERWSETLTTLPPGEPRLKRMNGELDKDRWEALAAEPEIFVARFEDAMLEAAREGAVYMEIRGGWGTPVRPDFMKLFREAERRVRNLYPDFFAEAIACTWPKGDLAEAVFDSCLAAREDGLAGVDFLPDPYVEEADWTRAHEWEAEFSAAGLGITAHVGEMSLANVESALDTPGLTRLGHGIQVARDERFLNQVIERRMTLECCLSSNALYGAVPSLEAHPLRELHEAGAAVTLNTDDPVRVLTSIGREYALALELGLSLEDLETITAQALEASFTTEDRRTRVGEWLRAAESVTR